MSDGYPVGAICDALIYKITQQEEYEMIARLPVEILTEPYRGNSYTLGEKTGRPAGKVFSSYGQDCLLLEDLAPALPAGMEVKIQLVHLRPKEVHTGG